MDERNAMSLKWQYNLMAIDGSFKGGLLGCNSWLCQARAA